MLLDLDDTILDDSGNVGSCWKDACIDHRSQLGAVDPVSLYHAVERTREWFWSDPDRHREGRLDLDVARREVARASLAHLGIEDAGLAASIADNYRTRRDRGIQPFPGAMETVRWLRESGCKMALLTNGSAVGQRSKVTRFKLEELFDAILIEGELGYGKPDARIFQLALEKLGVRADETLMVGDSLECDVGGPQQIGIQGIWIDVRGEGLPLQYNIFPNRIIRRLSDLHATAGATG
jgi:putative hydrolase of the HAD superfamily